MEEDSLISLIKSRRSIRNFKNIDVNENEINKILEAGIWSPTGTNQQELKYLVIKDDQILKEFSKYKKIKTAKCVIMIFIDYENYYKDYGNLREHPHKRDLPYIDTGLSMMNMMLHDIENPHIKQTDTKLKSKK